MKHTLTSLTQDQDSQQHLAHHGSHYEPISICETYQTDSAELLAPATTSTDEMVIDALYQSL